MLSLIEKPRQDKLQVPTGNLADQWPYQAGNPASIVPDHAVILPVFFNYSPWNPWLLLVGKKGGGQTEMY